MTIASNDDFPQLIAAIKSRISVELLARADGLKLEKDGANWKCCCPIHGEKTPSFTIYPGDGGFYCFGCGAGGDIFSYVEQTRRVGFMEAFKLLSNKTGTMPAMARQVVHKTVEPPAYIPIPVPHDAPPPPTTHYELGKPIARWPYHDAAGRVVSYAVRFHKHDEHGNVIVDAETGKPKKEDRPLTYGIGWKGSLCWNWKAWPTPRPLFNLHLLAANPDLPVIFCEGEKAATAAAILFPDCVCTTAMNGSQSPHLADWEPLRDRTVFVWPDVDLSGEKYAAAVIKLALAAGAASVEVMEYLP